MIFLTVQIINFNKFCYVLIHFAWTTDTNFTDILFYFVSQYLRKYSLLVLKSVELLNCLFLQVSYF